MEIIGDFLVYMWVGVRILFFAVIIYLAIKEIRRYRKKQKDSGEEE